MPRAFASLDKADQKRLHEWMESYGIAPELTFALHLGEGCVTAEQYDPPLRVGPGDTLVTRTLTRPCSLPPRGPWVRFMKAVRRTA